MGKARKLDWKKLAKLKCINRVEKEFEQRIKTIFTKNWQRQMNSKIHQITINIEVIFSDKW